MNALTGPMNDRHERLLYKLSEVAEMLGISSRTVARAAEVGDLEMVQAPGTTGAAGRRITAESLRAYLERAKTEIGRVPPPRRRYPSS